MSLDLRDKAVAEERKYMELAILNQQNSVANVTNLPKSKTIITPISKEMIQDYKDTLEAYGKKGGEALYDIPDIDLDVPVLQPTLSDAQKQQLINRDRRFTQRSKEANDRLIELENIENEYIQEYNSGSINKSTYRDAIQAVKIRRKELRNIIDDLTSKLEATIVELEDADEAELENKAELQRIDTINKEKLRVATETAKMYNAELNLESQGPNESNEEYADRIASLKNIVQPEIIKDDAEILVMKKFTDNMMQIIRNKAIITQILQQLGIPQAFEFNKIFPAFKKQFLEIYGYNNTALDADLIGDAIRSTLDKGITVENYKNDQKLAKEIQDNFQKAGKYFKETVESFKGKPEEESKKPIRLRKKLLSRNKGAPEPEAEPEIPIVESEVYDRDGVVNDNYLAIVMNDEGDGLFFIKYQPPKPTRGQQPQAILMASDTKLKDSFLKLTAKELTKLTQRLGLSAQEIKDSIDSQEIEVITEGAHYKQSKIGGFASESTASKDIEGWGIKTENIPETVALGKIRIKPRKLYYDNILALKDHRGGNIKAVPNITVSDMFSKLMFKILKNTAVSEAEIKELNTAEQNLYNLIIRIAELHKMLPNTSINTIDGLKKHLALIEGEIEAGNNNPKLLKDAKSIVKKLYSFAVITPKEANNYIEQLKEMF
jgi:hypothetical protein